MFSVLPDITELQLSNEFVLVLIISANFLQSMFPCRFQWLLQNNMFVKHLFSLLTLLFFVIVAGDRTSTPNFFRDVLKALILYVLFIVMTRNTFFTFLSVLSLLAVSFIVELRIKDLDSQISGEKGVEEAVQKETHENRIFLKIVNNVLTYSALFVMIVGCLIYYGQKRIEYKKSFSTVTFFVGKPNCKDYTKEVSTFTALKSAFDGISHR